MLDPIELLTGTLIPVLRSMATLVATVGDEEESIYSHVYSYPGNIESLFTILPTQRTPSILVTHRSTIAQDGRGNGIEHTYSCYLRPTGNIGAMFQALRDGIPSLVRTAAGLTPAPPTKFKLAQIHYKCGPPIITSLNMQSMQLEQQYIEYYEAPLVLFERGLDN